MKLRVLFLKRKYIYYFILVIVVFTFFILSHISSSYSVSTIFNINSKDKAIKADLTGDGKEDLLYITTNKDKYYLQVNCQKDSLYLEPSSNLNTLGKYSLSWPMRIKLFDASRDKVPEIFVQASQDDNAVQHIFTYTNNKFEDIFCSNNNVLGLLDCTNNKTPKIISGKLQQNSFSFSNYILIQNKLEKYNYTTTDTFMGKDTILYFINLITTISQNYMAPTTEIFDPNIPSSSVSSLSSLPYIGSNFIFQDALFMDVKSNKAGDPSQIQWVLNFRENSIKSNRVENISIKVQLKAFENSKEKYYFKIYSISLQTTKE